MWNRKQRGISWLGLILLQFLPIYTSENFKYQIQHNFVIAGNIIANNFLQYLDKLYFVFKIVPVILIALLLFCKSKKVTKVYLYYISIMYLIFAVVQNMGFVENYGFGIVIPNIIMCFIMSTMWFIEANECKEEYKFQKKTMIYFLLIPLCMIAFWDPPVNHSIQPISLEFSLHNFLFSFAGLAECMMTCIFISVYIFTHEMYNSKTFGFMCIIGIIRAIENVGLVFVYINSDRGAALAWLITHTPLLITSITGYILSCKNTKS